MNAIAESEPSAVALEIMPRADGAEVSQLELPALSAVNAATAAAIAEQRTKFANWLTAVISKMEGAK